MQIKIPRQMIAATAAFDHWANVTLYQRERIEVRWIDILTVLGFTICVAYYGWTGGWIGALTGAFAYAFMTMIALWFMPRPITAHRERVPHLLSEPYIVRAPYISSEPLSYEYTVEEERATS
jgi:hypothetical protein